MPAPSAFDARGAFRAPSASDAPDTPSVYGVDPDPETRCAHYRGPLDRVAVRFRCCGRYYACHACHAALESHAPSRWGPDELDRPAVLCGACLVELTIREYLEGQHRCPRCGAGFNPGCVAHRPLYFDLGGAEPG